MKQTLRLLFTLLLAIVYGGVCMGQDATNTVTDEITYENLGISSSYEPFSGKTITSTAEYTGVACKGTKSKVSYLQMKYDSSNNIYSGLYTTKSGGILKSVSITFNSNNSKNRTLVIVGKDTPFNQIDSKSTEITEGEELETIVANSAGNLTITSSFTNTKKYKYFGIRAKGSGTSLIDKITIVWEKSSSTEEAATTLSFPAASINANINSTITIPTATLKAGDTELTGETIEYSYTADKEGVVTEYNAETREMTLGNVEGTVTFKANYAGSTGKYKAADEASYTIHVANAGKTATTITFPKSSFTYQYGEEKGSVVIENIATISPAEVTEDITYSITSSSVEDFVILDEEDHSVLVNTKKVGTATITASFAGNDDYAASSASYTITVEDNRTTPAISFPKPEYSFELGTGEQTFTNKADIDPTDAGSLTYHSDKDWVAVDDNGYVFLTTNEEGTATITATSTESDKYKAASASYTIIVKKKATAEDGVFDFSKPENYGHTLPSKGGEDLTVGTEITAGNITLKVKTKGTADASWWNDGVLRIYKNSEHELSVIDGYHITSVIIEPFSNSYGKSIIIGGIAGTNWTGSAKTVSIVNDENNNSRIKSIRVTYAITVTPADQGFMTYAADYDVNYSELGFTTYAVKLNAEETKVTYNKFDGVVPAGKAVLLQGEVGKEFTLTPATEPADDTFDTDLITSDGTVTTEGDLYYAFSDKVGNKPGFKLVANGITIPAKRGYLKLKGTSAAKFFSFDGGNGTTGIGSIEQNLIPANATIYNLAGQRVSKDYKGVIIVNGKKMVNK